MATITINISDELNEDFRKIVSSRIGEGKGVLGKAVEDALKAWLKEVKQIEIAERQRKLMRKGVGSLKDWKFKREELYGRI